MHDRTKRINSAILRAKKRDHYTCQRCGAGKDRTVNVVGAHLLPRNSPQPMYRPDDEQFIVTLCSKCHDDYDKNKTMSGRHRWFMMAGLLHYARLILMLYGEKA